MKSQQQALSDTLYVLKALAILFIIGMHMPFSGSQIIDFFRQILNNGGMAAFLVISGYFYRRTPGDAVAFWKKKCTSMVLPWLFCALVTYLIHVIMDGGASVTGYLKWTLGSGSWYYFVTVLLVCFVVFRFVKHPVWVGAMMAAGLLSLWLTSVGVIRLQGFITDYLNVFNWFPFFGLGVLLRQYAHKWPLYRVFTWPKIGVAGVFVLTAGAAAFCAWRGFTGYFSVPMALLEVLLALCLFVVASWLRNCSLLVEAGKRTYPVYLLHMQPAGVVNRIPLYGLFYVCKPVAVWLMMYAFLWVAIWAARKLKLEKSLVLIGLQTDSKKRRL